MATAEHDDPRRAEWAEACATYSARLAEKPLDAKTLCNRSFVLLRLDRAEDALDDARRCIAAHPLDAKGHVRAAQALERLGRVAEARDAVARALDLDPLDEAARRLLVEKLDMGLRAGLAVLRKLQRDADERRAAVTAMLLGGASSTAGARVDRDDDDAKSSSRDDDTAPHHHHRGGLRVDGEVARRFAAKWGALDAAERGTLVARMLARAYDEIKAAYVDAFEPLEKKDGAARVDTLTAPGCSLAALREELLAANVVAMADLVESAKASATATEKPDDAAGAAKDDDDHDVVDAPPPMFRHIVAAAEARENERAVCGAGMHALMTAYRFPPFRRHPDAATYSADLIRAQRSTLCLVVAHLLLGGDGLPTVTPGRSTRQRPGDGCSGPHSRKDRRGSLSNDAADEDQYQGEDFFEDDDDDDDDSSTLSEDDEDDGDD